MTAKQRITLAFFISLSLKGALISIQFLTDLFLARTLYVADFGQYAVLTAFVMLLCTPALLGFNTLSLREVARLKIAKRWRELRGFLVVSNGACIASSILLTLVALGWSFFWLEDSVSSQSFYWLAIASLLPIAWTRLLGSQITALSKQFGQFVSEVMRPLLVLAGLGIIFFYQGSLTLEWVFGVSLTAAFATLFTTLTAACFLWPRPVFKAQDEVKPLFWLSAALPMLLAVQSAQILENADIIMLSALSGDEAAGLYRPAQRIMSLSNHLLAALSLVISPRFSGIYNSRNNSELIALANKSIRLGFSGVAVFVILATILASPLLSLWGPEYTASTATLRILGIGAIFWSIGGMLGVFLSMAGKQKAVFAILLFGVVSNIALNYVLIQAYGAEGAATATTISRALISVLLALCMLRELGFIPTPWREVPINTPGSERLQNKRGSGG